MFMYTCGIASALQAMLYISLELSLSAVFGFNIGLTPCCALHAQWKYPGFDFGEILAKEHAIFFVCLLVKLKSLRIKMPATKILLNFTLKCIFLRLPLSMSQALQIAALFMYRACTSAPVGNLCG